MKKKSDLPTKICPVCNRPFSWRKKWKKNWNDVKYCSKACANKKYVSNESQTGIRMQDQYDTFVAMIEVMPRTEIKAAQGVAT